MTQTLRIFSRLAILSAHRQPRAAIGLGGIAALLIVPQLGTFMLHSAA